MERATFVVRGFSDRTIDALIANGIDAAERLLFMTETELHGIAGIGKKAFAEVHAYRERFMRPDDRTLASDQESA